MKVYPFTQSGIFNINADIKFLIDDIDNIIEKSQYNSNINIDNFLYNNKNIIYEDKEEFEDDLDILKIDIEEKLNNEKNEIKDLFKEDYKDDYDIDRIKRPFEFKNHSPTLASKSTSASLNDDINDKTNNFKLRLSYTGEVKTLLPNIKEITPYFSDVFETQNVTIIKKNDLITQMTLNLFLKKIVVGNFFDDYLEYTINFSEQCFFFMKREIIIKKIIDCYNYYTEIKVPFEQRKKLIDLMSLLVIKLYNCFTRIGQNEEIVLIIKKFYNERIKEIKPIIENNQKSGNTIQEFFLGGINYIKNSVNKLINSDNKEKDKKEIKNENIDIKENLNMMLNKRKNINKENEQKIYLFKEENKSKTKEKEKEDKKEKEKEEKNENDKMIPEEQTLIDCEKILNIIKADMPKPEMLAQTEKYLYISKLKKNYIIKKEHSKTKEKKLIKCRTERDVRALKLEEKITNDKILSPNKRAKKFYFSCLNYDIKEIGEKLINVSLKSLDKIKRKELYNGAFLKKSKLITSPNVIENINKFNRLTSFIIEDILSYDFPQDRALILERWVYIAEYLKSKKDYNDILAINSALKNYIITGLNLTWKELSSKTKKMITDLDCFCSFNMNYKNFREDIKSLDKNEFYVPYLGMLLKDLNFYEEKYKYIINGNMLNFEKINGVQKILDNFFHFKDIKDKKINNLNQELNFFDNLDDKKETYLEDIASKLEPKFTLYKNPKKIKRLTYVDKTFFRGGFKRGSLTGSIKLNFQ